MRIVMMPLEMLRPAPYNPRRELDPHDPRYRKLRRSLRQFGLVEPLIWNRRTGFLVGGHQRLKILRELGWTEVPVTVVDLPPDRERALNIVLNNREAQSDWDVARLRTVLEELAAQPDGNLRETGFGEADLQLLRDQLEPVGEPEPGDSGGVEVVLRLSSAQFEMLRTQIDALVDEHNLECHVRLRGACVG